MMRIDRKARIAARVDGRSPGRGRSPARGRSGIRRRRSCIAGRCHRVRTRQNERRPAARRGGATAVPVSLQESRQDRHSARNTQSRQRAIVEKRPNIWEIARRAGYFSVRLAIRSQSVPGGDSIYARARPASYAATASASASAAAPWTSAPPAMTQFSAGAWCARPRPAPDETDAPPPGHTPARRAKNQIFKFNKSDFKILIIIFIIASRRARC